MKINIEELTEKELIDLNHQIVQRLRLIRLMKNQNAMQQFRIGDRVTFEPESGEQIEGMVTRLNQKSVSLITDDGHQWKVAPGFLRKLRSLDQKDSEKILAIVMRK